MPNRKEIVYIHSMKDVGNEMGRDLRPRQVREELLTPGQMWAKMDKGLPLVLPQKNAQNFDTKTESNPGETTPQLLNRFLFEKANGPDGDMVVKNLQTWALRNCEEFKLKPNFWEKMMRLGPVDREIIDPWLEKEVHKFLIDYDRECQRKNIKSPINPRISKISDQDYYELTQKTEIEWFKLNLLKRNVEVNPQQIGASELIRSDFENRMIRIGNDLADFVGESVDSLSHSKLAKGLFLTAVIGVAEQTVIACNQVSPTQEVSIAPSDIVPGENKPTNTVVEGIVTPEAAKTPTLAVGGPYTENQINVMEQDVSKNRLDSIMAWFAYWSSQNASNRVFGTALDSISSSNDATLNWTGNSKNPDLITEMAPYILARMDDGNYYVFTVPKGDFDREVPIPSSSDEFTIAPSDAPMRIIVPDGQYLAYINGRFSLVDDKTGEVVKYVDENGQLQTVDKGESLIEGNIFVDPQTEADFVNVVEAPSPIDEPEKNAKWEDEYLKQVNEKLKNWNGTPITLDKVRYNYEGGYITIESEWQTIASYKFKWQGREILTKTFVAKDQNGNLVPFSVTYTTPDSPFFDQESKYTTPTGKAKMCFRYEWEEAKSAGSDLLADTYLLDRDKNTETNIWRSFFAGMGNSGDNNKISRMHFIMSYFFWG